MPAPTGPVNITVTLDQPKLDALWVIKDKYYPSATNEQMMTQFQEWAAQGIREGIRDAIAFKSQEVAGEEVDTFSTDWDA